MSDPIKPGDLVMVVRDCCGHWVGQVFTVGPIDSRWSYCPHCSAQIFYQAIAFNGDAVPGIPGIACAPTAWLRRLLPPGELGLTQTTDKVPA